jgi:hypothetical protein
LRSSVITRPFLARCFAGRGRFGGAAFLIGVAKTRKETANETESSERAKRFFSVDAETSEPVSNAKRLCPSSTLYVAADEKNGTERFFCEKCRKFFARKKLGRVGRSESERRANPFRGAKEGIGRSSPASCEKCERIGLSIFRE